MIGALLLIVLFYFLTLVLLKKFKNKLSWLRVKLMVNLFWYHMFFALVYYVLTMSSPTDSVAYFEMSTRYPSWFSAYKSGTLFIHFLSYPFTNYLMFSYEMMMVLFAWLGYWGFVYFYIVFKENVRYNHKLYGVDLISLIIFLPNMHYWTASLGKGSIIFFAMAMAIYGLSRLGARNIFLVIGLVIVYHIRPHVFLFMAVGIVMGIFTGSQKVPFYQKFLVFTGSIVAMFFLYDTILTFAGLDKDNLFDSFNHLTTTRSFELSKAGSGLDTSNYPLLLKLVTFWFRPLFFDSPNVIGIIVSFENLLYVFLTIKLFDKKFLGYIKSAPALIKTSAVIFLATSFALSGTLSNLGIIIRQKSMVMYFLLLLIICFMDYKKKLIITRKKKQPVPQLQPA